MINDLKTSIVLVYALPLLAALFNTILGKKYMIRSAQLASVLIWISFLSLCYLGFSGQLQGLSLILALLIGFVSAIIHQFSLNYMQGDSLYQRFYKVLSLITLSGYIFVTSDNVWVISVSLTISNLLLVVLMMHKDHWLAARKAALLAGGSLLVGSGLLMASVYLLVNATGSTSLKQINGLSTLIDSTTLFIIVGGITMGGLIQSALWPAHRWLISSLNSPTPVSALMHAGLINAGGVIIASFAGLFSHQPGWLIFIFIMGSISALLGTYWKLVQPSIKRMLACSTLAQMGFMMMQCGMGFYSAAIAHLCWHGLFKGYLFLSAPSAVEQKNKLQDSKPVSIVQLLFIILAGAIGAVIFSMMSNKPITFTDTTIILIIFAFMACAQVAQVFLAKGIRIVSIILAIVGSGVFGFLYGGSIGMIQNLLGASVVDVAQPISGVHILFITIFIMGWLMRLRDPQGSILPEEWRQRFYVWAINGSKPVSMTITHQRQGYGL